MTEDFSPTDEKDFLLTFHIRVHFTEIMNQHHPFRYLIVFSSREHDVLSSRKHSWKTLEGLSAHDHLLSHGLFLEIAQIRGDSPDERPFLSDDALLGGGYHKTQHYTDTSILILPRCS